MNLDINDTSRIKRLVYTVIHVVVSHHCIFIARNLYYGCIIISQTKAKAYITNKLKESSSELF